MNFFRQTRYIKSIVFIFIIFFSLPQFLCNIHSYLPKTFVPPINQNDDTIKINTLIKKGNFYQDNNPDSALFYHILAKNYSSKIKTHWGTLKEAEAISEMGWDYYLKSEYQKSLDQYYLSNNILEQLKKSSVFSKDTLFIEELLAINYGHIGIVYDDFADFSKALDFYFKALRIHEKHHNLLKESTNLGNIGITYFKQKKYKKALDYIKKAYDIDISLNNINGQTRHLNNIGLIYYEQKKYEQAILYYQKALNLSKMQNNKRNTMMALNNLGNCYNKLEKYKDAIIIYNKALDIAKEINNKENIAIITTNLGIIYIKFGNFKLAEKYLTESKKLNEETGNLYNLKNAFSGLSELYEAKNELKKALLYHKKYVNIIDSINREENQQNLVAKEMQYQYEKEKAIREIEYKRRIEEEKRAKEKQITFSVFLIILIVIITVFSFILLKRLNIIRKQKNIIEIQKQILEEKNKDITDSILYSKRIQEAILPSKSKLIQYFPQNFVLYLPKDVIAGDFYFIENFQNYVFIAAADCTGHGVPGAMMSVLCSSTLTNVIKEKKITETDEILNRTRQIVVDKLEGIENIYDGMDICLIRYDKENNTIQYSGANRPLYFFDKNQFSMINPDKQPVGLYYYSQPFTKHMFKIQNEMIFYLTTDGFIDQFGGPKEKKLGTNHFINLLKDIYSYTLVEQKEKFSEFFNQWKQNNI